MVIRGNLIIRQFVSSPHGKLDLYPNPLCGVRSRFSFAYAACVACAGAAGNCQILRQLWNGQRQTAIVADGFVKLLDSHNATTCYSTTKEWEP